ncbi:MAG: hypothetical protein J6C26_06200 [Clostridia bacterium]|nr:hypothetical protein [Clostridia bacterium]
MLRSLVLFVLFFGLISMILPEDRKGEWIRLLLVVILFLSVLFNMRFDFSLDSIELPSEPSVTVGNAEREVLHSAVAAAVCSVTGERPISVESDLSIKGEDVSLTEIRVVIRSGDREGVLNELRRRFSFEGFLVFCEEINGSGEAFSVFP